MPERVTETTDTTGQVVERTVERDAPASTTVVERDSGGGGGFTGIVVGLALLAAVLIGGYFLMNINAQETARTTAVADAAGSVASTVDRAGSRVADAADRAADATTPSAPSSQP